MTDKTTTAYRALADVSERCRAAHSEASDAADRAACAYAALVAELCAVIRGKSDSLIESYTEAAITAGRAANSAAVAAVIVTPRTGATNVSELAALKEIRAEAVACQNKEVISLAIAGYLDAIEGLAETAIAKAEQTKPEEAK